MSRIKLIHHVNVQISDRARTRDWYVKVLGAEFLEAMLAHLHYTYIHDPDGNMIELVYHPLGIEDSRGTKVEVAHDAPLRWTQIPGFVAVAQRSQGGRL